VWLADHDLDGRGETSLTVYSGRGILSRSTGPVWMIGTGKCMEFLVVTRVELISWFSPLDSW